jgi:hypothetical protein
VKIKKLARKLQEELGSDPTQAKPSYQWCQQQVTEPGSLAFTDWDAFVQVCRGKERRVK